MTRDMDLIRGILLAIEENETLGGCRFSEILEWLQAKEYIATSDEDEVSAHCGILVDGGLIEKCFDYYESHASRQDKWFFFSVRRSGSVGKAMSFWITPGRTG